MFEDDTKPTVTQLMRIADVSERTARRWLNGDTQPPRHVVKLVTLTLNGRIIPDSWPSWWRFNHLDLFETETCHDAISYQKLTWFNYVIQAWFESLRLIPEIEGSINYLMDKLPSAKVIELEKYREELRELIRKSNVKPLDLVIEESEKIYHRSNGC